jgi:hypothetical protein
VNAVALRAEHRWTCPNCDAVRVTRELDAHTPFHPCAALAGFSAPMVPAGTRCKVTALERDDYIGGELVQRDGNGRPIMAIVTTRDDGEDRAVYAPTATTRIDVT